VVPDGEPAAAIFLLGCKSSLSVPLVDMSMDSRPNATVRRDHDRSIENRVRDLERENRELKERVERLEHPVKNEKEAPKHE
jgi:hypothetical protein